MPCTYYTPEEERAIAARETAQVREDLKQRDAMLCAVLSTYPLYTMEDFLRRNIDLNEHGVSAGEIIHWWNAHKVRDEERRRVEEKERQARDARAAALAKLTPEERKLLGVKG